MSEEPEVIRAGEYVLAVQGFAMIRAALSRPSLGRPRLDEMRDVLDRLHEFPHSLEFPVTEYDVHAGYSRWAPLYDSPNLAITREEPIVRERLTQIAPGSALDAACGTGRHAALLARLGHSVVGVDATPAMLDIARAKVGDASLSRGLLDALPFADGCFDVLTCGLALEHVSNLDEVFREFARVTRRGAHVVVSDMHPITKTTGGVAAFPAEDGRRGNRFVAGYTHQISDYTRAFLGAGFRLEACIEALVDEETLAAFPTFRTYPEATRQAFLGLPFVLVWHLRRE